ncbi:MAG: hypothetical protein V4480_05010 [Patescibacteria group bacterium]
MFDHLPFVIILGLSGLICAAIMVRVHFMTDRWHMPIWWLLQIVFIAVALLAPAHGVTLGERIALVVCPLIGFVAIYTLKPDWGLARVQIANSLYWPLAVCATGCAITFIGTLFNLTIWFKGHGSFSWWWPAGVPGFAFLAFLLFLLARFLGAAEPDEATPCAPPSPSSAVEAEAVT